MTKKKARKEPKSAAIRALESAAGGPLTFGRLLRSIREGEDQSLEAFARRLGVSRMHVHDIEKQRRGVSVERAAQWAHVLGYSPEQFVQLALQAQLDAAGLRLAVVVERAA
jgi:transcriptional regulator with XRE-family HTH domain